jgi:ribosomal protein L20
MPVRLPRPQEQEAHVPRALDSADQRGGASKKVWSTASSSTASNKAGVEVDRKVLADLAVHEPAAFKALCAQARAALN